MRKYLFLIVCVFILSSCSTYKSYTVVVDYSNYAIDGFFLTESSYANFEYMPIGHVIAHVTGHIKTQNGYRPVTPDDAMFEFVSKCKDLRSNCALNINILVETNKGDVVGYRVSGMAVKIPAKRNTNN